MRAAVLARGGLAVLALAALATGLAGGFARLGLVAAADGPLEVHGALMISGVFGTLIALERAVAHGRPAALLVPAVSAAGALLLALGDPTAGAVLGLLAGLGLAGLALAAAFRQPALFTGVMAAGAALWPTGTAVWLLGGTLRDATWIWLAFLVLTITGERIELARLTRPGPVRLGALVAILAVLLGALAAGEPWTGSVFLPLALGALALWLAASDVARTTIRSRGLARFAAASLLAGYGWLVVAAVVLAVLPPAETAYGQDAAVHAVAVGFVVSMVFAHAPIILPAVVGARVRYLPALWLPAALLQAAVAMRVVGGLAEWPEAIAHGACVSLVAMVMYAGILIFSSLRLSAIKQAPSETCDQARLEGGVQ